MLVLPRKIPATLARPRLESPAPAGSSTPKSAVATLRSRLLGKSAREHVVLDFLEDDLLEVRSALSAVVAYLTNVEAALLESEPSAGRFLSLAQSAGPCEDVETLTHTLSSLRRRLAQVAARM